MIWSESLWRDEAFSVLLAKHNPLDIIKLSTGDPTPPLFYELLHFWIQAFGSSEVAMRVLTALFFLATAGTMYLLGRLRSKETGLWLTALALTQPLLLYYGFEVRAYSLLALLTSLTLYFYFTKRWVWLAVSSTLLLYTHLFGFWVVATLLVWSLRRKFSRWPLVVALGLYFPWTFNYLALSKLVGSFLAPPGLTDLPSKLVNIGAPILLIPLLFVRKTAREANFWLLAVLWVVPIAGTFLISQAKPFFLERYLIVAIPAQLLLVGLVIGQKYSRLLLGLALATQAVVGYQIIATTHKEPFQDLADFVKAHEVAGDSVINGSSLTYFESQYYGLDAKIYSPHNDVPYYIGKILIPDQDIVTTLPKATRLWVIELGEGGGMLGQPLPLTQVEVRNFGRLKVTLYDQ